MSEELKSLVGKVLSCESKAPGRDIVTPTIEVHAALTAQTSRGPQNYLYGYTKDGQERLLNTGYIYPDTIVVADSPNFKKADLKGIFFIARGDDGQLDPHWANYEHVSAKALKRLPLGSVSFADAEIK